MAHQLSPQRVSLAAMFLLAGTISVGRAQQCVPVTLTDCKVDVHFRAGAVPADVFSAHCMVTLGAGSNGIDPVSEGIRLMLSDADSPLCSAPCFDHVVVPQRFGRCWRYRQPDHAAPGLRMLKLCDVDPGRGVYRLTARSNRTNLQCLNGPALYALGLTIGDDCVPGCGSTTPTTSTTSTTLPPLCNDDGGTDPTLGPVVLDCPTGEGYEVDGRIGSTPGAPELRILGIYESRSDHSFGSHPTGEATVNVSRQGPTILVLSSYEPTHWTVNVVSGALVERVILNGYYDQTATVPAGVPIENHSPYQRWLGSYGYAWPDNTGGGSTANLIFRAEELTGQCLASFHGCYRATRFGLPPGPPAPTTTTTTIPPIATTCTGDWSTGYNFPQDADLAPGGSLLYVLDTGSDQVVKLDPNGAVLRRWGTGNPLFKHPRGMAVDAAGNVYVSNDEDLIRKYDGNGTLLAQWGGSGIGNGQLASPDGMATDAQNNLYVSERYNHRIQKFDATGHFLMKWGGQGTGDGQFNEPRDVAVDVAGNVFVADVGNDRFEKFGPSGNFLAKWGGPGTGDGQFRSTGSPYRINLDPAGNLYICDNGNSRIQKFSGAGVFLTKWGAAGTGDGQFNDPHGIAVDAAGNAYVVDYGNGRVQRCRVAP